MDIFTKLKDYQEQPVRNIMREAKTAVKGQTVFLGDSLIQSYNIRKYFPENNYYNCGVNGATSELLLRLHEYAIADYKPSKVVILIGTNDLNDEYQFDKVDIALNIYNLIQIMKLRYALKDVVVLSPLPIIEAKQATSLRNNGQLKQLGVEIEKICGDVEDTVYVDVFDAFLDGSQLNSKWTEDGLHLNEDGYAMLTSLIKSKI